MFKAVDGYFQEKLDLDHVIELGNELVFYFLGELLCKLIILIDEDNFNLMNAFEQNGVISAWEIFIEEVVKIVLSNCDF